MGQDEEEKPKEIQPSAAKQKSDLFRVHMKKVEHPDGRITVKCNYCDKEYQWSKSGGYGTYRKHISSKHPDKEMSKLDASLVLDRKLALKNFAGVH